MASDGSGGGVRTPGLPPPASYAAEHGAYCLGHPVYHPFQLTNNLNAGGQRFVIVIRDKKTHMDDDDDDDDNDLIQLLCSVDYFVMLCCVVIHAPGTAD